MNTAIVIALIALVGSIFSTIVTVFGTPVLQARSAARKILEQYREPLLDASYELQARLYNIIRCGFIETYISDNTQGKQEAAINSTFYVFAQFFGWREIIRREIQYLHFSRDRKTQRIGSLLQAIGDAFLTDEYGPQSMIWRVEQRGIGERMIVSLDNKMTCMGYASFVDCRPKMREWLDPIERALKHLDGGGSQRWRKLQHLLLELVKELDGQPKRYPDPMVEA